MDQSKRRTRFLAYILLLILRCTLGAEYHCLEDYKPIGNPLLKDGTPAVSGLTAGQVARRCSIFCDQNPSCASFYAASNATVKCQLMSVTNADFSAVFVNSTQAGNIKYPLVRALLANGPNDLRTLSYLCFKKVEDWDFLGSTTYQTYIKGSDNGGEAWCAFGTDTAGRNIKNFGDTEIVRMEDCATHCRETSGCDQYTYARARPELVAQKKDVTNLNNCFVKDGTFTNGINGWIGPTKTDIWIPDAQVPCFLSKDQWQFYGLQLSPSVQTIGPIDGMYYTLYPERVTYDVAKEACATTGGAALAMLKSRELLDKVGKQLLQYTPEQGAGYTFAWIDAEGTSANGATAVYCSGKCGNATSPWTSQQAQQVLDESASTLQWSDGRAVAPDLKLPPRQPSKGFTGHDCLCEMAGFPAHANRTCTRVFSRLPTQDDADVTDGKAWIWFFDCGRAAPFICQSTGPPTEPGMSSRSLFVKEPPQQSDSKTALIIGLAAGLGGALLIAVGVVVGLVVHRRVKKRREKGQWEKVIKRDIKV